jgi:flagellar biosynthesis protein FlhG
MKIAENEKHLKVIAVSGGKGGVGKTHVAVNLAITLSQMGKKCILFDADFGLSNVDIVLGLKPQLTLLDVVEGNATLQSILIDGPAGLKILPGASGVERMAHLNAQESFGLIQDFVSFYKDYDYLIVDTAAGISSTVVRMAAASDDVLIVAGDDPASLTDAYSMIKVLNRTYHIDKFKVLINRVNSHSQAEQIFAKLTRVADQYLSVVLQLIGWIKEEPLVKKALKKQQALVCAYPTSDGAKRYQHLASEIIQLPNFNIANGCTQFFVQRFVDSNDCYKAHS